MSETPTNRKRTVGEELFLIHLSRFKEATEADYDHEDRPPRKPAMTVGEELWRIHCKRSQGLPQEEEEDEPPQKKSKEDYEKDSNKGSEVDRKEHRVIHLRNRDVSIP